MNNEIKVIVIGGNHHNTLGVIRGLGRKGVRSHVIVTSGGEGSFVLKSKYIEKGYSVQGSQAAIDLLFGKYKDEAHKPIVIACHDVISSHIDLNRERLQQYFIVPGCEEQGRITHLMNKKVMGEEAQKYGLAIPQTFILKSGSDEVKSVTYPCITKPVESMAGSKSEIHICKKPDQLTSFLANEPDKDYVVQQFVEKDFEFQLIGCSIDGGNDIIIPGYTEILRQPKTTNTGFLHYQALNVSFDKTIEATKSFIRGIRYSGLFSVEFLRDKQGVDYFMEMNFRNDGNTISVTNAGVTLPYIWFLSCIGEDYKSEIKPVHDEYVMPEFTELALLQKCNITIAQWWKDMRKATCYMDYAEDDPAPTDGWKRYNHLKWRVLAKHIVKKLIGRYEKN